MNSLKEDLYYLNSIKHNGSAYVIEAKKEGKMQVIISNRNRTYEGGNAYNFSIPDQIFRLKPLSFHPIEVCAAEEVHGHPFSNQELSRPTISYRFPRQAEGSSRTGDRAQ